MFLSNLGQILGPKVFFQPESSEVCSTHHVLLFFYYLLDESSAFPWCLCGWLFSTAFKFVCFTPRIPVLVFPTKKGEALASPMFLLEMNRGLPSPGPRDLPSCLFSSCAQSIRTWTQRSQLISSQEGRECWQIGEQGLGSPGVKQSTDGWMEGWSIDRWWINGQYMDGWIINECRWMNG